MVYMFAALTTSDGMDMTGMGSGMAGSLKHPALALAFASVLVCYSVWDLLGQLSVRRCNLGSAISRCRPSWRHRADGSVPYRHGRDHGVHAANHELTGWVRPARSRSRICLCKGGWLLPGRVWAHRSHSAVTFSATEAKTRKAERIYSIRLLIEEEDEHRWCLWRPDHAGFDSRWIFEAVLIEE